MTRERIVEFTPAFDKRSSDPSKDYGIHGVDMRMVLKGENAATQFVQLKSGGLGAMCSDHRIISFIHDVRTLDRKWKNLTADQKRAVLETLGGEADEPSILKAIKKAKKR